MRERKISIMKNKIYFHLMAFVLLAFSTAAFAQIDRSKAPEPGPAPRIELGDYQSFDLKNGLKVIVVEDHTLPVVTFRLFLDYTPFLEGDASYASMAGSLLRMGTTNRSKQELDEEIDFIGATLNTSSRGITASGLKKHMDPLLDVMTDILYHPVFPQEELDKLKKQTISGLSTIQDNPQAMVANVSQVLLYGKDHPYGEIQTEEIVENTSRDLCVDFYNTYFKPNIAYLVVVGDLKLKDVKKIAKERFGQWEAGEVPAHSYSKPPENAETRVAIIPRSGAVQSYVDVCYTLDLKPGTADIIPVNLMSQIFGGGLFSARLMQNLREDKAFTYGAIGGVSSDPLVGSFSASAQVRNSVTDSTVQEIFYEMNRLRDEPISAEELQMVKNYITGSFSRSLESPQTIANFALSTFRYHLPEDYYATYLQKVEQVSREDVQEAAKKYLHPEKAFVVISGDAREISGPLARFDAQPEYYDYTGEPVDYGTPIPEGMTAEKVIKTYIAKRGGREALEAVKDITYISVAKVQGMSLDVVSKQIAPYYIDMRMSMNGTVMQRQVVNDKEGFAESMGNKQSMPEEQLEALKASSSLFPELLYLKGDYELVLEGIEKVEGKDAYLVKVTTPSGTRMSNYYDMESGLLVKTILKQESPAGEVEQVSLLSDYREVNGILFPFLRKDAVMGQNIEMIAKEIKMNTGLKVEDFK